MPNNLRCSLRYPKETEKGLVDCDGSKGKIRSVIQNDDADQVRLYLSCCTCRSSNCRCTCVLRDGTILSILYCKLQNLTTFVASLDVPLSPVSLIAKPGVVEPGHGEPGVRVDQGV